MKILFLVFGLFLSAYSKEWEIQNTGVPLAQKVGSDELWIVSDQSFNCLDKNSSFLWRVSAGEKIIQAIIIDRIGIVYLSRENNVSKVGLRLLDNGDLKWEVEVGNVYTFSCHENIFLDDGTALNFNGMRTDEKKTQEKSKRENMEITTNGLKFGSYTFNYDSNVFGEPKLYDIYERDLLVSSESGETLFYSDLELKWTRDESLTKVITSTFVKVGDLHRWVAVTASGMFFILV